MKLLDYYENVVLKTIKTDLPPLLNKSHMALGFASEMLSEFTVADINGDVVNAVEEIGDAYYFVVGFAHFYNVHIPNDDEYDKVMSAMVLKFGLYTNDTLFQRIKTNPLDVINRLLGDMCTILKKEITSNVLKLDGKILTHEDLSEIIYMTLYAFSYYASQKFGENDSDPIGKIREINGLKLVGIRHKDGFSVDTDLNRNLEAERKLLTEKVNELVG